MDRHARDPYAAARARMLDQQLRSRGVHDPRVLAAMAVVPRERFVPPGEQWRAYDDCALPAGAGQTISQPLVVLGYLAASRSERFAVVRARGRQDPIGIQEPVSESDLARPTRSRTTHPFRSHRAATPAPLAGGTRPT